MLYFTADEQMVIEVNEAFSSRFLPAKKLVGRPLTDFTQPLPAQMTSTCRGSITNSEKVFLDLKNGTSEMVEIVSSKINNNGETVYLASVQELFPPIHTNCGIQHPLYKSVFEKARDIILVANNKGEFVQVNDTACQKLGYSRKELLDMRVLDITHGPIRSYGNKKWDDFLRTGGDEGEYILQTKDGNKLYAEYRAVANIRPGMHLSILRDVTQKKQLQRQEEQHHKAIQSSISGIFYTDSNFRLTFVNRTCLHMLGYDNKEDVLGRPIANFCKKSEQLLEMQKQLLERGKWQGALTAEKEDGTEIQVLLTMEAIVSDSDDSLIWQGSFIDITEQVETQKALSHSETRFSRLLEAAPDGILIIDKKGIINFCNSQICSMLGYEAGELQGQSIEMLIPQSKRVNHIEQRMRFNKNPHKRSMGSGLELWALRKDGSKVPVDIMLGPLEENGKLHVLAIIRDITKFREAQQKINREKEFTKLFHTLTTIANQATSIDEALQQSINKICSFMEWPVGHVYFPADDGSGEFYPSDIWYIEASRDFEAFKKFTMVTRFSPGMGMIGKVIETGRPQWYENAHENSGFIRRLPDMDLNIRACFAFPILVEEKVVAVMEFFSDKVLLEDTLHLEKMATIGNQLGQTFEREKAKKQLRDSEAKFKTIFETAFDAIFILDKNHFVDCNKKAGELFRLSREELMKTPLISFLPHKQPDGSVSGKIARQQLEKALKGKNQFLEWRFKRPDGSQFDAEVGLIHMKVNGRSHVQVIIRDITERKQANRLIRKNTELFSQLFQNSPVGKVMSDVHGKVININDSFEETFGYKYSEIEGREVDDFLVPDHLKKEARQITGKSLNGMTHHAETVRLHKSGKEVPVLLGTVPVQLDGEFIALFGIYVDLSERKNFENELRQSLKDKEVLIQEIHHRVKNNLAVVSSLLELQIDMTENRDLISKLRDSQTRIYSMALVHEKIYQIELFSSLELSGYIRDLVNSIENTYWEEGRNINLDFKLEPVELNINQAVPCGQLINEIITNAFKHAFSDMNEGEIQISLNENDGTINLVIADNGPGIDVEILEGHTESLGITLIHTLTQQLDGTLIIDNESGTKISIEFPIE